MARVLQWWMLGMALLAGTATGEESYTVGYVLDGQLFSDLARGKWSEDSLLKDPFDPSGANAEFTTAVPVEPPVESRFFIKSDELLAVTGQLREAALLEENSAWGIYNRATEMLVIHAPTTDHAKFTLFWRNRILQETPKLLSVRTELLEVASGESRSVEWTADELKRRGARSRLVCWGNGRIGQKFSTSSEQPAERARLGVEGYLDDEFGILDFQLSLDVELQQEPAWKQLSVRTALTVPAGGAQFLDLGDSGVPGKVLVLQVEADGRFLNGVPFSEGWMAEDGTVSRIPVPKAKPSRTRLDGGLMVGRYSVPPTILFDLTGGDYTGSDDPFNEPPPPASNQSLDLAKLAVEPPIEAPYLKKGDHLYDLRAILNDKGVGLPEHGWAVFNARSNECVVAAPEEALELVEVLAGGHLGPCCANMVAVTASLVAGDRLEMQDGRIPEGLKTLRRIGGLARPGQRMTVTNGIVGEGGVLVDGLELEIEPNIGASAQWIDLNYLVRMAGERSLETKSGVTLRAGRPLLLPLVAGDQEPIGLLLEARVIDLHGGGP